MSSSSHPVAIRSQSSSDTENSGNNPFFECTPPGAAAQVSLFASSSPDPSSSSSSSLARRLSASAASRPAQLDSVLPTVVVGHAPAYTPSLPSSSASSSSSPAVSAREGRPGSTLSAALEVKLAAIVAAHPRTPRDLALSLLLQHDLDEARVIAHLRAHPSPPSSVSSDPADFPAGSLPRIDDEWIEESEEQQRIRLNGLIETEDELHRLYDVYLRDLSRRTEMC